MIKKIRVKKQLTFKELMEYIFDNNIEDKHFTSNDKLNQRIYVKENGVIFFTSYLDYNVGETYEVELEEEITEDTKFDTLVEIFRQLDRTITIIHYNESVRNVRSYTTERIYKLVDGELQLIWERE